MADRRADVPDAPSISQGLLTERLMLSITGIEDLADSVRLPVSPGSMP